MTYQLIDFPIPEGMQDTVDCILNRNGENHRRALVVGWRQPSYNEIFYELKKAGYIDIVLIDIFKPNIELFKTYGVRDVIALTLDVRDSLSAFGEDSFDLIVFSQGPEHLYLQDAFSLIHDQFKRMAKFILIETPLGIYPQEAILGNEHEKHLSTWYFKDYTLLGFTACYGENDKHIIGLWCRD